MEKSREYHLDLLRILACYMVIINHVSGSNWWGMKPTDFSWQMFDLYDTFVRAAVPLFFMISGKLFLSKKVEVTIKELFSKYIVKYLIIYILWSMFYAVFTVQFDGSISGYLKQLVTITAESHYHLWYIPYMIGIHLLIPTFNSLVNYKNGKYIRYVCFVWFLFYVIKPTMLLLPFNSDIISVFLNKFNFPLIENAGYFLLGYWLSQKKFYFKKVWNIGIYLVVSLFASFIEIHYSIIIGEATDLLYGYFILPFFIQEIMLFSLFLHIDISNIKSKYQKIILVISNCTFGIYLIHPFILEHNHIFLFGLSSLSFNALLSVPLLSLLIFLISFLFVYCFKKIPYLKKYI